MSRRLALAAVAAALAMAAFTAGAGAFAAEPDVIDAAPADAWPLARGCLAGTGRSAAELRLPLAEAWRRDFEKTAFGAVPVIAADTIYVGDLDGTFHALALDSGATRWSFKTEAAGFPAAAAVSTDPAVPLVVVGDDAGVVRALDRGMGAVRWEHETAGEISGGPTILPRPDGARVLVGSQDASLTCLDLAGGAVVWTFTIADQIRCAPTVVRTEVGDRVLIAGCDGRLHIVDADTGAAVAAVPIDGPTGTTPAASGALALFGTEGGSFFAIDVARAAVAWQARAAAGGQSYRSSAAVADGLAIVGSRGRAVEAFSLADGARAWRRPMRGRVDASPVVVAARGGAGAAAGDAPRQVAIVADAAGRIAALDARTGEPAWEFEAGGDCGGG
ncbi:MAG: PQQ-binding-like beta-propeller repeat protein, partial [Planctomycetaceae bacterium]